MDFVVLSQSLTSFIIGYLILRYRKNIYDWTGRWDWAEKYLGDTVTAIILIGAAMVFFSVAYPLGAFDGLKGSLNKNYSSPNTTQTQTNDSSTNSS